MSTGTTASVTSEYLRIKAANPAITGHAFNDAKTGATMAAPSPSSSALSTVGIASGRDCEAVIENNSGLCEPELDKQIVAAGLLAGEPRYAAYREIARHLYEESVDYVFFVHLVNFARVNPRINYTPNVLTNTKIRLEDITFN